MVQLGMDWTGRKNYEYGEDIRYLIVPVLEPGKDKKAVEKRNNRPFFYFILSYSPLRETAQHFEGKSVVRTCFFRYLFIHGPKIFFFFSASHCNLPVTRHQSNKFFSFAARKKAFVSSDLQRFTELLDCWVGQVVGQSTIVFGDEDSFWGLDESLEEFGGDLDTVGEANGERMCARDFSTGSCPVTVRRGCTGQSADRVYRTVDGG